MSTFQHYHLSPYDALCMFDIRCAMIFIQSPLNTSKSYIRDVGISKVFCFGSTRCYDFYTDVVKYLKIIHSWCWYNKTFLPFINDPRDVVWFFILLSIDYHISHTYICMKWTLCFWITERNGTVRHEKVGISSPSWRATIFILLSINDHINHTLSEHSVFGSLNIHSLYLTRDWCH